MKERRRYFAQMRKRLSKCRKRLDILKKQGFHFSNEIYYDIESIEKKIKKQPLFKKNLNKKISISIVNIIVISAICIYLFWPSSPPTFDMKITNLPPNHKISGNYTINGTANVTNGKITILQVNINDIRDEKWNNATFWKNTNGTYGWNYSLIVDNLNDGENLILFRCGDGKTFSDINSRTIIFEREIQQPSVNIMYPKDGDTELVGTVNITGITDSINLKIENVEIRFYDNGYSSWYDANLAKNDSWYYNWDTAEIYNESIIIEVRCYDGVSLSNVSSINVKVNTTLVNYEENIEISDFSEGEYFQIYFPGVIRPMKPNKNYELRMYYRQREISKIFSRFPINIRILEIQKCPSYVTVTFPEQIIRTSPDNKIYYISYIIAISDDAPRDIVCSFTVAYEYYTFINIKPAESTEDVFIKTGQW